jgi:hypothetical protein
MNSLVMRAHATGRLRVKSSKRPAAEAAFHLGDVGVTGCEWRRRPRASLARSLRTPGVCDGGVRPAISGAPCSSRSASTVPSALPRRAPSVPGSAFLPEALRWTRRAFGCGPGPSRAAVGRPEWAARFAAAPGREVARRDFVWPFTPTSETGRRSRQGRRFINHRRAAPTRIGGFSSVVYDCRQRPQALMRTVHLVRDHSSCRWGASRMSLAAP